MCWYCCVSEFCLLYLPARDVSQKKWELEDNPPKWGHFLALAWNWKVYIFNIFIHTLYIYVHLGICIQKERGREKWCDDDEVHRGLIILYLKKWLDYVIVLPWLPRTGDAAWLCVFKQAWKLQISSHFLALSWNLNQGKQNSTWSFLN